MNRVPAPGHLPDGVRVYAVGDIHGCNDRLATLHLLIAEDLKRDPIAAPTLLHLGDYIDRGPDSAGVVERLSKMPPIPWLPGQECQIVNLIGNHERTMLEALAGERASATDWLMHGGREALASWGIEPPRKGDKPDAPVESRNGLRRLPQTQWEPALPPHHVAWLKRLAFLHRIGGYLFVHAGVRPGTALDRQSPGDLVSIRHSFLSSNRDLGAVIVHGHTVRPAPEIRKNRIGIDTGAVYGGPLTCAVLEGGTVGFLTA